MLILFIESLPRVSITAGRVFLLNDLIEGWNYIHLTSRERYNGRNYIIDSAFRNISCKSNSFFAFSNKKLAVATAPKFYTEDFLTLRIYMQ